MKRQPRPPFSYCQVNVRTTGRTNQVRQTRTRFFRGRESGRRHAPLRPGIIDASEVDRRLSKDKCSQDRLHINMDPRFDVPAATAISFPMDVERLPLLGPLHASIRRSIRHSPKRKHCSRTRHWTLKWQRLVDQKDRRELGKNPFSRSIFWTQWQPEGTWTGHPTLRCIFVFLFLCLSVCLFVRLPLWKEAGPGCAQNPAPAACLA